MADIGGTNARFALATRDRPTAALSHVRRYRVEDHPVFEDALATFLGEVRKDLGAQEMPGAACLALAAPVSDAPIRFTNSTWVIEPERISRILPGVSLRLLNDFEAVALAIPGLTSGDLRALDSCPDPGAGVKAICGPGTGLGVCSLVPTRGGAYLPLPGEGGHVDFAPVTAAEIEVLRVLMGRFQRVSYERLLSGPGLENLYQALAEVEGISAPARDAAAISSAATGPDDALARAALDMFCALLGAFAGNLALTVGARGGVFLAGGITPRICGFLETSAFRARFEAKGRFQSYLRAIPTRAVLKDDLGLLGAARYLAVPPVASP